MKKIILICITTMLSQYALAENWKFIVKDEDGSFYLDTDRIVKKDKTVNYWAKFVADADSEEQRSCHSGGNGKVARQYADFQLSASSYRHWQAQHR